MYDKKISNMHIKKVKKFFFVLFSTITVENYLIINVNNFNKKIVEENIT